MIPKRQKDGKIFIKQNSVASSETAKTKNIGVVVIKRKNHLNLMDTTALATYSIIIKSLHQLFFKIFKKFLQNRFIKDREFRLFFLINHAKDALQIQLFLQSNVLHSTLL